jgi:hypothetical protein
VTNPKADLWIEALTHFNERNLSRSMDLEVINDEMGVQSEARGLTLHGVAFDRHDGAVEIMLGGRNGYHITHTMGNVTAIDMLMPEAPSADVLRVVHAAGQTILTSRLLKSAGRSVPRGRAEP